MSDISSDPPVKKPGRRLHRLLWAALTLALLYLAAGNLFLVPHIGEPVVNRKPEKLQMTWSRGWTLIPGILHLRDLHLEARAGKGSWSLDAKQVRGRISLWSLLQRQFRIASANGHGLDFIAQLPPRVTPGPESFQPDLVGTQAEGPPKKKNKKPWHIVLQNVAIEDLRTVTIGPYRFEGAGRVSGAMQIETRGGPLSVPGVALNLSKGQLFIADELAARVDLLQAEVRMDPARREERRGRNALRFLSGQLEVQAPEARLSALSFLFQRFPTMDLDGEGSFTLVTRLDHGVLKPGTTLYAGGDFEVGYLDYDLLGVGEIAGAIAEAPGEKPSANVDLTFEAFELRLRDSEAAHVVGRGATVQLTSEALDLVALEPEGRAWVEIPDSEVPNLAYYNRYIPGDSGIEILAGTGRLSTKMKFEAPAGRWSGDFTLRGESLRVKFQDSLIEADLELDAKLPGGSIESRRADISGTELTIDRALLVREDRAQAPAPWWARLELPEGEMTLADPLDLKTSFRATLKDTAPLIGLIRKDKKSPPWLRNLLTVEDVAGTGEIRFQPERIEGRGLTFVAGKHIEVQGNLRLAKKNLDALLFCRYRKLSASLEMIDGNRDWDLVGSRKWFQDKELEWLD